MCVLCLRVCVCVLKPEANDSCLPLSVPVFFETRSLTEPRAHQLTNLPGQEGPEILQCPSQSTRFADTSHDARLRSFLLHILLHVMLKLQDVQKLCPKFLDHPNQCRRRDLQAWHGGREAEHTEAVVKGASTCSATGACRAVPARLKANDRPTALKQSRFLLSRF